ncbi:integrase (plasmid) [Brachyspira hyodysenteriae]|nr:integrase [Brachyspira hyodysenteriae]
MNNKLMLTRRQILDLETVFGQAYTNVIRPIL